MLKDDTKQDWSHTDYHVCDFGFKSGQMNLGWNFRIFFAWYDLWIGLYYDRHSRIFYICPLPCCVFEIRLPRNENDFDWNDPNRCLLNGKHNINSHSTFKHRLNTNPEKQKELICTRCGIVSQETIATKNRHTKEIG